jgi:hypothetical protein
MVGHGVRYISYRQDPGLKDDLTALQPLGIPRAVHALMVLEGSLGHRPGEIDPLEDLISRLGMYLDE